MEENSPTPKFPEFELEKQEHLTIKYAMDTVASDKHPERNEDAILADVEHGAFGIFDGVGGHMSGDIASTKARDYISRNLNKLRGGIDINLAKKILSEIIIGADEAVYKVSMDSPKGATEERNMATTAVVLKIHTDARGKNYALIANIGDSRAYKIQSDGKLEQLTVDDDILSTSTTMNPEIKKRLIEKIANARKKEDLDKSELFYFKQRNMILKGLGSLNTKTGVNTYIVPIQKGDRFLITSDGIHDNLTANEIQEIAKQSLRPSEIAKKLTEASLNRSREPKETEMRAKADDMSVVVVDCK